VSSDTIVKDKSMVEIYKSLDSTIQASRWGKLKESVAKKIDHKSVKGEVKSSTSVVGSEKKKSEVKKITPIKKAPIKSSGRPIEQVLVGSWNALKQIPEKQGRGIVNIYDKLRFPKLTTEEQKVNDKVHVFLKKYQKEIGWGVTGVEAAAVTYGVVKGFQYLKERNMQKRSEMNRVRAQELANHLQDTNTSVVLTGAPVVVEAVLSIEQQALKVLADKVNAQDFFAKELLSAEEADILSKCHFSHELRQQIHEGVLERFIQRIPRVIDGQRTPMPDTLRRPAFDDAMVRAGADFAIAHKGLAEAELRLLKSPYEMNPIVEIMNYVRVMRHVFEKRGFYNQDGFDGRKIEDLLQPKRRRKVAGT